MGHDRYLRLPEQLALAVMDRLTHQEVIDAALAEVDAKEALNPT